MLRDQSKYCIFCFYFQGILRPSTDIHRYLIVWGDHSSLLAAGVLIYTTKVVNLVSVQDMSRELNTFFPEALLIFFLYLEYLMSVLSSDKFIILNWTFNQNPNYLFYKLW